MKRNASLLLCIFTIGLLTTALPASPRAAVLHKVSVVKEHPRFSIVFVESNTPFKKYDFRSSTGRADYVELDLYGVSQGDVADRIPVKGGAVDEISLSYDRKARRTRVRIKLYPGVPVKEILPVQLESRTRGRMALIIDLPEGRKKELPDAKEARELKKQGYRIVIIDPGHGWFDPGAAYYKMEEKTVVLDIAFKLAELINQSGNMRAYLTRTGDYLPLMRKSDYQGSLTAIRKKALQARVDFARELHGDVFLSLHLNSTARRSRRQIAKGFEIYYLDPAKIESVADEQLEDLNLNDIEDYGTDVHVDGCGDDANALLMALKAELSPGENRLLAQALATSLRSVKRLVPREKTILGRNFRVLRNLFMPSVLVEMGFLSNSSDASNLKHTGFRWELARAIYTGTANYFSLQQESYPTLAAFHAKKVTPPNEQYPIHIVEKGESLFVIAQKYATSPEYLKKINDRRSSLIHPGDEIKVPVGAVTSARTYTVRSGDTLSRIADAYSVSIRDLRAWNGIRGSRINPGDELVVSAQGRKSATQGKPQTAQVATKTPTKKSTPSPTYYRARRGDSLYVIARKYRTSVERLKRLNGLRGNRIDIGQKLRVR